MKWQATAKLVACAAAMMAATQVQAAVFYTDPFSYPNGQLTGLNGGANVSGGVWVTHSGTSQPIPVVDGKVEVNIGSAASGSEDVNRPMGQSQATGSTWYFATKFTVQDLRMGGTNTIGQNYFMHLSDGGETNFRGRLYIMPPNTAGSTQFTLGLSSSSVAAGNGAIVKWATDLTFDTQYTVVVSYIAPDSDAGTTMDGFSSLWVNPVNSASTSITDSMPNTNVTTGTMNALALRQASQAAVQPKVTVDIVSAGDSFGDVLAAVSTTPAENANFNEQGVVDGADLALWKLGMPTATNATHMQGDANADGDVDGNDFLVWQRQLGTTPAAGAAIGAVPEPASFALAAVGLALLAGTAGRRRH